MANIFRRAISGGTLRKKLSSTVFKAGTKRRFTNKTFQKQLQKSSNPLLRRKLGFNKKGGTLNKHEALQSAEAFYKEAAEKKDAYSMDKFTLRKRGMTIDKEGNISKIASERMYQKMSQEEAKAEAPKGPTKEELEKQKKHEEALKQIHKWERARQNEMEEKQKKENKGALSKPEGPTVSATPGKPVQAKESKPMQMPSMAHGGMRQFQHPQRQGGRDVFSESAVIPVSTSEEVPLQEADAVAANPQPETPPEVPTKEEAGATEDNLLLQQMQEELASAPDDAIQHASDVQESTSEVPSSKPRESAGDDDASDAPAPSESGNETKPE